MGRPWGISAQQLVLFAERDPERFLAACQRLGVDHILTSRRSSGRQFDGGNYPESFIQCVAALVERGRLHVLWGNDDLVLVGPAE